jgi:hypothetical protein
VSLAIERMRPVTLTFPLILLASLALAGMGAGVPSMIPLLAFVVALGIVALPMRWSALPLLAIALIVDNPGERPMDDRWRSPFLPPGELLYLNLHKLTGIEALRFSALELMGALLILVVLQRKLRGDLIDDPDRLGALPNPLKIGFGVMFAALVWLELYGLGTGGDFKNSLWQLRQLAWLPLFGVLFGNALKTAASRRWLLRIVLLAAWVRACLGIYFYMAIARPTGERPPYVTTHSDAVLAVIAILIALAALVVRPSREHVVLNLVAQPVLLLGLILNDRRIAFVSLFAGIAALVLMAPGAVRRTVQRGIVMSLPFVLVYAAVGWTSEATIFRPVSIVRSVINQDDTSSQTRDIENYNLIYTLKHHPVLGSGFGHEYMEKVQGNRVDQFFAQYRFIAHNSILWLLSLAGAIGFALIWACLPTAVLIGLITFRMAPGDGDRLVAYAAIAAVLCFVVQAWGDMGLQSWMGTLLVASLTGAAGAIYTRQQLTGVPA